MVGLDLGDATSHRSLRAGEAEGYELVEADIGADLGVAGLHPLLDLGHERVDEALTALRPLARQLAGVAPSYPVRHCVMRRAGQLASVSERLRQIKRFKYLHDLLAGLHLLLLVDSHGSATGS